MKHTYKKLAVDILEPGESPNNKYCPNLCEEDAFNSYEKSGFVVVGEATVTVEYFDDATIHKSQLTAINAELQAVRADNQKRENEVLDKLSKLQALTYVEPA